MEVLPFDIVNKICEHLSTRDMLALRRASKAVDLLFSPTVFDRLVQKILTEIKSLDFTLPSLEYERNLKLQLRVLQKTVTDKKKAISFLILQYPSSLNSAKQTVLLNVCRISNEFWILASMLKDLKKFPGYSKSSFQRKF